MKLVLICKICGEVSHSIHFYSFYYKLHNKYDVVHYHQNSSNY